MRSSIGVILDELRKKMGLRNLPSSFDKPIIRLSLMRNCLLHNSGNVDAKLANFDPSSFESGKPIEVTNATISRAIKEFRSAALALDASWNEG
jgi:hypothetical protein